MVFEKVQVPQATVLPVFAGDFKRYSNDLSVALTAQITTLWARAETLDLNSNIQDKVIKTAYIDDLAVGTAQIANLAVTNAKIDTLAVSKLTAGTITSQSITMALTGGAGDVCIKGGKADFGDNTAGMIFGMDDSDSDRVKFEVGDATNYLKWDGLTLSVAGTIAITGGSVDFASRVSGTEKPANNATVGATWGTNLGSIPATLGTPGADGLYLTSSYIGFYQTAAWKTYIANDGKFAFSGDANNYVEWNGTTLYIKGNVTITGGSVPNANVTGLGALAVLNTVTYGGSTVTGFGALAALGSVAASNCDTTIISGGKIITGLLTATNIQAGTLEVARLSTSLAYITNTAQIANAVISTANIGNLQVTSATIADLTVGGAKITDFSATRGATAIPSDLTGLNDNVAETAITGASVTVNCSTANDTIRGVFKVQVTPPIYYSDKASTVQATVTIRVRKTNISGTIVDQSVLQAVGTVNAQTTTSLNCFFVHAPGATGDVTFIATYQISDLTSTTYTGALRSMKMDVWRRSK